MLNDYELFLGGCYSAVVEIKNDYELYGFIDLMTKLGFKNYANYIKELDEKNNFIDTAKRYNNVNNLCMEYQIGKGFTFGDKEDYLKNCKETKVLTLEDLKVATSYNEDFKEISLTKISGNNELEILEDFCDMYGWLPVLSDKYGFNILDTQLDNKVVEDECYKTFNELVNRIVGRAIDYFRDEMCWDKEDNNSIEYGLSLLKIAKQYKNDDKWEESWLETFENELKEF